jgi:hypothetical protein
MKPLALGFAAGLLVAGGLAYPLVATPSAERAPVADLVDTLVLARWGHGALDWLLPDPTGDPNVHQRRRN